MDANSTRKDKIREIIQKYRKSGEISIKAKKLAEKLCVAGAKAHDIVEKIEGLIRKEGALPAFPVNLSINHEAAHYSPEILDTRIIPENSITKIDLGAQIDGYIVDTAITINLDPELDDLAQASKDGLDVAIEMAKPGVKVKDIGKEVEKTIQAAGFEPIRNLSGHQIKRYVLHAGVSIPNCSSNFYDRVNHKLEAGRIYAIEPFASTGKGWVINDTTTNIFRYAKNPSKKADPSLKKLAQEVKEKVGVLPFSPRHLFNNGGKVERDKIRKQIRQLLRSNVIVGYPVLIEEKENIRVSQHEDTVRITREGCEVLTRAD